MTYLSRIWLNPLRRDSQRLLRSPQAMHATVLGGLPLEEVEERVLWRLDVESSHRLALYVLTRTRPSWEHLVEQAGWPGADCVGDLAQYEVRPYEPLLERIHAGQEYAFRLTANPTSSTRRPVKMTASQAERGSGGPLSRSVRVGHRTARSQIDWFLSRAEKGAWGFEVPPVPLGEGWPESHAVTITGRERKVFTRRTDSTVNGKGRVTIQVVTFEGRLQVTDPDRLREVMVTGVGRAKAYGCGLLTLAPLGRSSA